MAKLTEQQKTEIVAKYMCGEVTQKALANEYKVSETTIRNTIHENPDFAEKCGHIKKEAEETALLEWQKFFSNLQPKVQKLIAKLLNISDKEIEEASLREKAGFLKILVENFVNSNAEADGFDDAPANIEVIVEDASGGY